MKGLIEDVNLKNNILNKFVDRFVLCNYTFVNPATGGLKLLWCNFKDECKIYSTDKLFKFNIKISNNIYFYSERTQEMYFTDFNDVCSFVNNLEPWDVIDAEIFDDSLEWVIAITHEDVSKVYGINVTIDEYDYEKDMTQ